MSNGAVYALLRALQIEQPHCAKKKKPPFALPSCHPSNLGSPLSSLTSPPLSQLFRFPHPAHTLGSPIQRSSRPGTSFGSKRSAGDWDRSRDSSQKARITSHISPLSISSSRVCPDSLLLFSLLAVCATLLRAALRHQSNPHFIKTNWPATPWPRFGRWGLISSNRRDTLGSG